MSHVVNHKRNHFLMILEYRYRIRQNDNSFSFCIKNSEDQRLTVYTGKPLSSTTLLIFKIKFHHLKLHGLLSLSLKQFNCCE